jgi:Putative Ig domain
MRQYRSIAGALVACVGAAVLVAGCGGGSGGSPPPTLTISGRPGTSATVGQAYTMQPVVSGGSGTVTYSATGLPGWLTISSSTGLVSGTPAASDVGTDSNIIVTASAGGQSASLPAFTITVSAANGSVVLSWTVPTANTDGSALTDLAGFVILYGQSAGNLNQQIPIADPTVTSYQLGNLTSGTWYFAIVSVNSSAQQSSPTNVVRTTI